MAVTSVFLNVLTMLICLSFGFALVKTGKAKSEHAKSLSAILVYICSPCLIIKPFLTLDRSAETLEKLFLFFFVSLATQLLFFFVLLLVLGKRFQESKYRVLSGGAIFGNVGFFGIPIITSIFPNDPYVPVYAVGYILSMNLLIFTLGVFLITKDKKYISLKAAVLNPTVLAFSAAMVLYVLHPTLPELVTSNISLLASMTTPLCMFVLGFRLASMSFKSTFSQPFAYVVASMKLVIYPVFAYACVFFLPFLDYTFKITLLTLSAAPAASVLLSMAELHECEQKLCANVLIVTVLLCLITLPILIFILA